MRIYYIGQLWEGGTCLARMRTLDSFGHDVVPFDVTPWTSGGKGVLRSLAHRTNSGPPVWGLNRALRTNCHAVGQVDLVWVDKGRWIYPETLDLIHRKTNGSLLHYTPDAHFFSNRSRHFLAAVPRYDWLVTTKPFERELYRLHSGMEPLFILQGYDPHFLEYKAESVEQSRKWKSDVCFIGHCQPHYAERLKAASEVTSGLKIWGANWPKYANRNIWAQNIVCGNGVWGVDYLHALAHTKIALGLLGKHIPETTTTRSFEIPSMGTFMLAERTEDHLALFEEGKEAEFFGSDEEMQSKIRYYLANDDARIRIAVAGRKRCLQGGYGSEQQLKNILECIAANFE